MATRADPAPTPFRAFAWIGTGIALVIAVAVIRSFAPPGTSEAWSAFIIAPLLFAISLPILARQATRESDRRIFAILALALALKLVATVVRYYVTFEVYERADATDYHESGLAIYERFRTGDFTTELPTLTYTNFIRFFTGVVYTVIGPTKLGGFLVFSWLGFWGLFLFYRAFVLSAPDERRLGYARLVFFLPSLLYWPSAIGKESWMMFALGVAVFGCALLLSGKTLGGFAVAGVGLWLVGTVRPHMAGIVAIALATAYLLRRSDTKARPLAPLMKAVALCALVVLAVVLVGRTDQFLQDSGISTSGGFSSVLGQITERTSAGGSEFVPSVVESPGRLPIAIVTVLFRPHILDANNAQALIAAVEGAFLFVLSLIRIRSIFAAFRSLRSQSYVAFALVYSGLFIIAFSGIANFGLLVRERVQLIPLYLVLLFALPAEKQEHVSTPQAQYAER
jgi:hypothetical protein